MTTFLALATFSALFNLRRRRSILNVVMNYCSSLLNNEQMHAYKLQ